MCEQAMCTFSYDHAYLFTCICVLIYAYKSAIIFNPLNFVTSNNSHFKVTQTQGRTMNNYFHLTLLPQSIGLEVKTLPLQC